MRLPERIRLSGRVEMNSSSHRNEANVISQFATREHVPKLETSRRVCGLCHVAACSLSSDYDNLLAECASYFTISLFQQIQRTYKLLLMGSYPYIHCRMDNFIMPRPRRSVQSKKYAPSSEDESETQMEGSGFDSASEVSSLSDVFAVSSFNLHSQASRSMNS
jgi:hypothetical protein